MHAKERKAKWLSSIEGKWPMPPCPTSVQPPLAPCTIRTSSSSIFSIYSPNFHTSLPSPPTLTPHHTFCSAEGQPQVCTFRLHPERFCNTPGLAMADSGVVREENPTQYHGTKQGWEDHVHQQNLKKGVERLDRRSGNPNKGAAKKHGHGGKFTMDGPYTEEDYADPVPAAMDENDPNYVDPADEQADKDAGISTVEVAKVAEAGAGTAHPAS